MTLLTRQPFLKRTLETLTGVQPSGIMQDFVSLRVVGSPPTGLKGTSPETPGWESPGQSLRVTRYAIVP